MKIGRKRRALFFSRFSLEGKRAGGGFRRELQVARALSPLDFRFISALEGGILKFFPRRRSGPRKMPPSFWHPDFQGYAESLLAFSDHWANRIPGDIGLAVMDDPVFFPSLAEKVKKLGIPMIVTCQNIESLSTAQINPWTQDRMLGMETGLLSLADLVITLSREEAFFLNNLNMRTFYFPYYPVDEFRDRLLKVREIRKKTKKSGLLLLGTINNRPTLDGFMEVIRFWDSRASSGIGEPLIVAGWGTEKVRHLCGRERVEFRGTLEDSDLDDLLGRIKACLCYQKTGAGALTKICEMLIAGIPVLANSQSARSYHRTAGLIEFSELGDLARMSPLLEQWEGTVPIPPQPEAGPLLEKVREAIG